MIVYKQLKIRPADEFQPGIIKALTGCLQLLEISLNLKSLVEILEISWNFIDALGKFKCQLK